jgi:ABC-type bacteriocin/lantibiotic exporter with double-glycine peptidase domain
MNGAKGKILLLPVKPVIQRNSYECGVACVGTILKTIGLKYDRIKVKEALKTNPKWGTDQAMIKKYLRDCGVSFLVRKESSIVEVERQVKKGRLCLVAYQAWGAKKYYETMQSGHYSVVCGYENNYLWLADPFVKKKSLRYQRGLRKIRKEVFLERWKDVDSKDKVYSRWFLAI